MTEDTPGQRFEVVMTDIATPRLTIEAGRTTLKADPAKCDLEQLVLYAKIIEQKLRPGAFTFRGRFQFREGGRVHIAMQAEKNLRVLKPILAFKFTFEGEEMVWARDGVVPAPHTPLPKD